MQNKLSSQAENLLSEFEKLYVVSGADDSGQTFIRQHEKDAAKELLNHQIILAGRGWNPQYKLNHHRRIELVKKHDLVKQWQEAIDQTSVKPEAPGGEIFTLDLFENNHANYQEFLKLFPEINAVISGEKSYESICYESAAGKTEFRLVISDRFLPGESVLLSLEVQHIIRKNLLSFDEPKPAIQANIEIDLLTKQALISRFNAVEPFGFKNAAVRFNFVHSYHPGNAENCKENSLFLAEYIKMLGSNSLNLKQAKSKQE